MLYVVAQHQTVTWFMLSQMMENDLFVVTVGSTSAPSVMINTMMAWPVPCIKLENTVKRSLRNGFMRIQECANVAPSVQHLLKRLKDVIMCSVSIVVPVFAGCAWNSLTRARSVMLICTSPMVDLLEFVYSRFCVIFQFIIHTILLKPVLCNCTISCTIQKFVYSCSIPTACVLARYLYQFINRTLPFNVVHKKVNYPVVRMILWSSVHERLHTFVVGWLWNSK